MLSAPERVFTVCIALTIAADHRFCLRKKTTDSKPYGLPSVALAKDGGGGKEISDNSLTLKMAKVFQV